MPRAPRSPSPGPGGDDAALVPLAQAIPRSRCPASPGSRRGIIRRPGTSAARFHYLLDQTNYRKSIDQVLMLLHVLDCDVDLVVRSKSA